MIAPKTFRGSMGLPPARAPEVPPAPLSLLAGDQGFDLGLKLVGDRPCSDGVHGACVAQAGGDGKN